ncbi:hypothetical protein [Croceicoccus mobilis]|uniref:Uncharacterized protein n=1 Tax=Croceicoccus mobilis TaxID=1703339 RepID=A0A916Z7V6_9SPHN|nr:hypothetical protein [Croceicoccus mobilis]GGD79370.1 hypothetical protein GCM10010990_31580 [Croceicoccus mobilis]
MVEIKSSNMAARPHFFEHPESDELVAIVLALATELAVAQDRADTLERVLEGKGLLEREDLEGFRPDEKLTEERRTRHKEYLRRIFRVLRMQTEPGSDFVPFDKMTEFQDIQARASKGG